MNCKLLVSVLLLTMPSVVMGKTVKLDLPKAWDLAQKSSDELKSRMEAVKGAQADLRKAKGAFLPSVDLSTQYQKYINPSTTQVWANVNSTTSVQVDVPIKQDYGMEATATLTQVLYTFGKIASAIDAAQAGVSLTNLDQKNFENELRFSVTQGVLGTVLAMKTEKIFKESLKNARDNNSIFRKRFSRGRAPQSDSLRLERDIESRKPNLDQAEESLGKAMANIKMLTGIPYTTEVTVDPSWPKQRKLPSLGEARGMLVNRSTGLKVAQSNVALKEQLLESKKSALYPDLALFANTSYFGEDDEADFSTDDSIKSLSTVGVSITIPVYSGGTRYHDISKSRAELSQAKYDLSDAQRKLSLLLESLYIQHDSYTKQHKSNKNFLKLAKSTFDMSQRRFKTGQASIIELNDAELLLTQAKLQIEQSLYNQNLIHGEILKLLDLR